jgi:HK97 family phage major capsid protein
MKKKFKDIKTMLADAKAAWLEAKRSKKAEAELKTLHAAYSKLQIIVDEAEAAEAEDDDEIEIPSDKAKNGKQQKADSEDESEENEDTKTVTLDKLQEMLTETVAEQIKALLPEKDQKDQVTNESIKAIIKEVIEAGESEDVPLTKDAIGEIIQKVTAEQIKQIRKGSKQQFDSGDDNHEGKIVIELPSAHTKGNLPLHMKQLLNVMMKRDINSGITEAQLTRGKALGDRVMAKMVSFARSGQKALTSTTAGSGDEWVPTDLSSELLRRFYLSSDLAALLLAREVDMPTQPYEYPLATTRPTFYLETTENVAATESSPGTSKVTLDAKKLMGRTDFSYEVDEDAIIPILPFVQEQLASAAADAYESAVINGDTAGTHQDSDTELIPKAAERSFNGFRKLALAISVLKLDLSTGGINEANLRAMKKALKKYGVRVRDLLWIAGPAGINDMQGIANVTTLEKYGPRATILTGELASFLGIPIIVSERVREDLNASGVYDGVTTTKGSILLVNLNGWIPGRRRDFTVEIDKDIKTQTNFVVASFRRAFTPIETPSATIRWLSVGYNFNS